MKGRLKGFKRSTQLQWMIGSVETITLSETIPQTTTSTTIALGLGTITKDFELAVERGLAIVAHYSGG